jgi:hypothetical protein
MSPLNFDRFARIGSAAPMARFEVNDMLNDCAEHGLLEELRAALSGPTSGGDTAALRAVRDLVYELAGASNRDLAVDVLIHATGLAEFDCRSLREYARKHGMTAEGFRLHVHAMQRRLNLPRRPMQHDDASAY